MIFLKITNTGVIMSHNIKKEKPRNNPKDPPNSDTKDVKS